MKKAFLFFLLLFLPYLLIAALSPLMYIDMQKNASEVLTIKVKSTTTTSHKTQRRTVVTVIARVLTVVHSKSRINKGDLIRIDYQILHRAKGYMGAAPLPILKKNKYYKAFLRKDKQGCNYILAAGSHSFSLSTKK